MEKNQNKEIKIVWLKNHIKENMFDICYKEELSKGIWKHYTITFKPNKKIVSLLHRIELYFYKRLLKRISNEFKKNN